MSEKSKTTETSQDSVNLALNAMTQFQKAGLGSLGWMGTGWMTGMSEISSELVRFVADRIKEDVKTQHEILHAKGIGEIQSIQSRFLKEAFDQYTAETGKLIEMGNDMFIAAQKKAKD